MTRLMSPMHLKKFHNIKLDKYPIMLIKKVFTLRPKTVCVIFLLNETNLEVLVYNTALRDNIKFQYHISKFRKELKSEFFIKNKLYVELGNRIFVEMKNLNLFRWIHWIPDEMYKTKIV